MKRAEVQNVFRGLKAPDMARLFVYLDRALFDKNPERVCLELEEFYRANPRDPLKRDFHRACARNR